MPRTLELAGLGVNSETPAWSRGAASVVGIVVTAALAFVATPATPLAPIVVVLMGVGGGALAGVLLTFRPSVHPVGSVSP